MSISICGADCQGCPMSADCSGCRESNGHPFGEKCMVASCCERGEGALCKLKEPLLAAFNGLQIPDMPQVTDLYALRGAFINMPFSLPSGECVKFWNDNKIYLGNQLPKGDTDRCYGIAADETHLMVCEYGENGADPQLVLFKRWAT